MAVEARTFGYYSRFPPLLPSIKLVLTSCTDTVRVTSQQQQRETIRLDEVYLILVLDSVLSGRLLQYMSVEALDLWITTPSLFYLPD